MILKEFIPDAPLQKYLHRFWIASSFEAIPAEKCVLDGKEFRHFTGQPPVAFYSKPHPIKSAYVGRAWKNLR